ncbi:MAG TPA: Holliday junction resolvase RuvX [Pirellulales bacterium]|jgi:putative Holliday junction resolvase|nr:Holliday junction resolvase RuvX [Pirellulales bacterium]
MNAEIGGGGSAKNPDADTSAFRLLPSAFAGRIAGIDYGTVRIGVAVTDARRTLASPLENYTRRGTKADAEFFVRLAREEQLAGFVVGLPVHSGGEESAKSTEARAFGKWLGELTGLPVEYFDERFTTVEAEQFLAAARMTKKQRKARLDKLAAQIMLSAYLESRGKPASAPRPLDG